MADTMVFIPAWNEERALPGVLAEAHSALPGADLLVIDDGSTDGTAEILDRMAAEVPFMRVLQAPQHPNDPEADRLTLAAEARAFNAALATVDLSGFTHVGKLDADVELPPEYFERLLAHFDADPELGIAGGVLLERTGRDWEPTKIPDYHVRGALKLYSRACFEAIGGVEERLGWDTIDETYARMRGYSTRSVQEITARHHRPVATRGGALRGRARHGQCAYILRYGAWWVILRSFKVGMSRPYGLTGIAFLYGYFEALLKAQPKVEDERFKRFVRGELRGRLLGGSSFFRPSQVD
jgi:glycosyltransferase involved in cell wall biosynthesis